MVVLFFVLNFAADGGFYTLAQLVSNSEFPMSTITTLLLGVMMQGLGAALAAFMGRCGVAAGIALCVAMPVLSVLSFGCTAPFGHSIEIFVSFLLMKLTSEIAITSAYVWASEAYPVSLRGTANGALGIIGRLGGIVACLLWDICAPHRLHFFHLQAALLLFASIVIITGMCADEANQKLLQETVSSYSA
eukprot:TRINITY_DN8939_c1_g1_i1.p4 TRINITY_DN8939_c1_g1~~TRINITY_DN8939_c1_g1_i1.p4  ORF type:complete len:190 (+),score=33.58 TRINITY_DN8939_c1_g1_i1:902-1471(+)